MANGASRLILAENALDGNNQTEINKDFKNENDEAIATTKIELKAGASEHNHSK